MLFSMEIYSQKDKTLKSRVESHWKGYSKVFWNGGGGAQADEIFWITSYFNPQFTLNLDFVI